MGQKTLPQSLRLDHLKNWKSDWIVHPSDYAKVFYLEFTLQKYLTYFCKRNHLYLHKVHLRKVDQQLIVALHFYNVRKQKTDLLVSLDTYLSKYLNTYLSTLGLTQPLSAKIVLLVATFDNLSLKKGFLKKKKTLLIRRLSRFPNLIKITYMAFYLQNPDLLNHYLGTQLQKNKRHKSFLKNVKHLLDKQLIHFPNCLGYRLEFNGRVNGRARAKPYCIRGGKNPSNTLDCIVNCQTKEVLTSFGMCNLKTFFYYNK